MNIIYLISGFLIIILSGISIYKISNPQPKDNSCLFSRNMLIIIIIITVIGTSIYYLGNKKKKNDDDDTTGSARECPPPPTLPPPKDFEWGDRPKKDALETLKAYQHVIGQKQINHGEADFSHTKCIKSNKVLNM